MKGGGVGRAALLMTASIASGALGYFVAQQNDNSSVLDSVDSPKFGSPNDFKKAIDALKDTFDQDTVSTDPDDLHVHGFSANDYHPGELYPFLITILLGLLV